MSPNADVGVEHARTVAAGAFHFVVLDDSGGVWSVGGGRDGELGIGTHTQGWQPARRVALPVPAADIAAGDYHSCAATDTGAVLCWGSDGGNELGVGVDRVFASAQLMPAWPPLASISRHGLASCAAGVDGSVWCVGDGVLTGRMNCVGGPAPMADRPERIAGIQGAIDVVIGDGFACALVQDRRVQCRGSHPDVVPPPTSAAPWPAAQWVQGITDALTIAGVERHVCVTTARGTCECFGMNDFGQLGDGTNRSSIAPVLVALTGAQRVQAAAEHTCAIADRGEVWCWGRNVYGQLGDGTHVDRPRPVRVAGLPPARDLALSETFSCAIDQFGDMWCWGYDTSGGLMPGLRPEATRHGLGYAVRSAGFGDRLACAIDRDRVTHCWGESWWGEGGNGSFSRRNPGAVVVGANGAAALSVSWGPPCVIDASHRLLCWSSIGGLDPNDPPRRTWPTPIVWP